MAHETGSLSEATALSRKRRAAEKRYRLYGLVAISIGLLMLVILLTTIITKGMTAFQQTFITLEIELIESKLDKKGNRDINEIKKVSTFGYAPLTKKSFEKLFSAYNLNTALSPKKASKILSKSAASDLRKFVLNDTSVIGKTISFEFLTNSWIDGYLKGRINRDDIQNNKNVSTEQLDLVDELVKLGIVEKKFNLSFLLGSDASDMRPEAAGFGVSMVGSFYMMLVVLLLSLPVGVAASIYLEEFAPRNWITDIIEVNISNLAAVPSIVFGILGLAVFINFMHLPQSAPFVGGMVLTLMTLPTIIISTRASLKSVPPSIRDAALGVGASKMQTVFHHVLPLAAPGILTGTIIGLAQALGETAPLLLIGMIGYIATNMPSTLLEGLASPNSAMPAQIYEWAKRSDPAFYERAWGGIIILLVFLITMNTLAVILRRRFERRW